MFATSLALIGQEFHGKDRATAFGVWGATVGGAVAIGPLVGGVITENLGWEWIFFVNVPIGIAAMVLTERKIVNVFAKDPEPIDVPGLVTFSLALFLLIFGLIRGNPEGWGSPLILVCLIGAGGRCCSAFIAIELRSDHPMLDLSLFRKPAFNGVSAVAFGLSAGMFAMFLYLTIYMQGVLGFSPLGGGPALPAADRARLHRRADLRRALEPDPDPRPARRRPRHGRGRPAADARGLAPTRAGRRCSAGFLVAGIGIGITNPGIGQAAIAVVPVEKSGMGSGINTTFRQVGIATGVAGAGGGLPVAGRLEALRAAAARAERLGEIVASGGSRAAAAATAARGRGGGRPRLRRRLRRRLQRDHPDRRDPLLRRRRCGFFLVRSRDFVQPSGGTARRPGARGRTSARGGWSRSAPSRRRGRATARGRSRSASGPRGSRRRRGRRGRRRTRCSRSRCPS